MVQIISVHIPKTAGSLFWKVLEVAYGEHKVLRDYLGQQSLDYHSPDKIPDDVIAIHGHFPVSKYAGFFSEAKRITWLRYPIFQMISLYCFWLEIPYEDGGDPVHRIVYENKITLLEMTEFPSTQNILSQFTRGLLLEEFYFVGLQEFFAEDLRYLSGLLEWSEKWPVISQLVGAKTLTNRNLSQRYLETLNKVLESPGILNHLSLFLKEDLDLYHHALQLRACRNKISLDSQEISLFWQISKLYTPTLLTFHGSSIQQKKLEHEIEIHALHNSLQYLLDLIFAMRSSKFWQLRSTWLEARHRVLRLLSYLGLRDSNEKLVAQVEDNKHLARLKSIEESVKNGMETIDLTEDKTSESPKIRIDDYRI